MIITCENCTKKFNLQDDLIPEKAENFSVEVVITNGFLKLKKIQLN